MSAVKLCLIGTGEWSRAMHLPVLQKMASNGAIEITAVCDLQGDLAKQYATDLNCNQVFTDGAEMLRKIKCDGILLLVSTTAMPAVIKLAISHGKPFLCEKPPAIDSKIHRELIAICGDLPHLVSYNRRHSPYIRQARAWMAEYKLQSVTCHFSRYRRRESDFGATAVHAIDTMRFLGGADFAEVKIETRMFNGVTNGYINGWYSSGARFDILITPDTGAGEEHYILRSTERTVFAAFPHRSLYDIPGKVERRENNKVVECLDNTAFGLAADDLPYLCGIAGAHADFVKMLSTGWRSPSTLAATLQTQEVREQFEEAARKSG